MMTFIYDDDANRQRLMVLGKRGVKVSGPNRVYVDQSVCLERICPGAVLVNGDISGVDTFVGSNAEVGTSGTAFIRNAQIGRNVRLGAGTYENCVLLNGVKTRGFAELRQGCVLEEDAEIGHNVGIKNTTLTVGAVAGSLINFCDVLLTGGSSRSDHSEIGSGAVHFNFDPRGDKFGSLMGDASGCLLRSRRIFIGGNTGIVGPIHVGFGAVVAAGSTVRKDVPQNQLSTGDALNESGTYDLDRYFDLSRKFCTTAKLIGNLHALRVWYREVRRKYCDPAEMPLYMAAEGEFKRHIQHRTSELCKVIAKLEHSISKPCRNAEEQLFAEQHRMLLSNSERIMSFLTKEEYQSPPAVFTNEYEELRNRHDHPISIISLSDENASLAATWLLQIAGKPHHEMRALFSSGN